MPFFTKKPVTIEAWQFEGTQESFDMIRDAYPFAPMLFQPNTDSIAIETLEGTHRADAGDWIIKGVKGEFYPCKSDIFSLTYDEKHDG